MNPPQNTVSAIVVTWNSIKTIEACIDSLQIQSHPVTIVVIDNASSDGTPDLIADKYPDVTLLRQSRNHGFAKANNIGISASKSEWVLALNPDAYISADWVECLLNFAISPLPQMNISGNDAMSGNGRIGMLGGLLLRAEQVNNPTQLVIDSLGIEIFRSRRVRDRDMGRLLPDNYCEQAEPEQQFGICAAASLYNRAMLVDVSINGEVLPESFFSYYEDADLAWRAWRRGWSAWMVPSAIGWHHRGGSPIGSRFSRYMTHRNRLWMILRNEPINRLLTVFPELFVHELLMLLRVIRYPYLIKAVMETLRGIPQAHSALKQLPDTHKTPPPFQTGIGFK